MTPDKFSVTDHGILCDPYGRRPATAAEQWSFCEIERLRAALERAKTALYAAAEYDGHPAWGEARAVEDALQPAPAPAAGEEK